MNKPTFIKESRFTEQEPNPEAVGGRSNWALSSNDVGVTECSDDFIWVIFFCIINSVDDLYDFVVEFDEMLIIDVWGYVVEWDFDKLDSSSNS